MPHSSVQIHVAPCLPYTSTCIVPYCNCQYRSHASHHTTAREHQCGPRYADGTFLEDWQFNEGSGDLDKCNGLTVDGKYANFLTDEFPYIPRCLSGIIDIDQTGDGGLQSSEDASDETSVVASAAPGVGSIMGSVLMALALALPLAWA